MSFFNKKEEVIDLKLTQYGKDLLARGKFKPEFYQFFDDDILYNSELGGFSEHQNSSEARILENTPKLKIQPLTLSVESRYFIEQTDIEEGRRAVLQSIHRIADQYVQDRILLYPLGSHEIANQSAPKFDLRSLGERMQIGVTFPTGSGIRKNIPQINISASFVLSEDRTDLLDEPGMVNLESFFDLSSREVVFADNSKIKVSGRPIILDLEELNVFYGLDNFELELYEITKRQNASGENKNILSRITDIKQVNDLFHIKTDEDIEEVEVKTGRKNNYYRSNET
jgi:hypothetical protein